MTDVAVILIAVFAAFLAFRFVAGLIKFAVLAAIAIGAVYFLSQGVI